MSFAAAIVGTLALPAYAFAPGSGGDTFEATAATKLKETHAQSIEVDDEAVTASITSDSYAAVTAEEIAAAEAAEAAAAAAAAAEAAMVSYAASYSGPSVNDFLASPPYPNYDLGAVFSVASQYQGVPYVYGGASPAGFDCSGFVMYVFAQFGIGLPHSTSGQAASGTRISEADAQPGDLVVMPGHIGFYAGNGMILHAPYEGTAVRIQPIWSGNYSIVRIGI